MIKALYQEMIDNLKVIEKDYNFKKAYSQTFIDLEEYETNKGS